MKHSKTSVAGMVAAAGLATVAHGQNTWTGSAGTGDWHTGQNWSMGITPQPGHEVVIPQGVPGVSSLGAFIAKLTAQSPLSVGTGGTSVVQNASLTDFSTTGGFLCDGSVSFSGNVTVQSSYPWRAVGGFTNQGTMNVTAMALTQCSLINQGTINVQSGPLSVAGTARLLNNGTLELRSGGNLLSNGLFRNNGAWRKVGATDSEVQCNIDHASGTLAVEDGVLRLTGGGFYTAPMTVELGGKIRLEGPFVGLGHFFDKGTHIDGAGELEVQCAGSGAVQVFSNVNVNLQGGNGLHMQSGGVMIAQNRQMLNRGKVRWDGGAFEGPGSLYTHGRGTLVIPAGRSVGANDGLSLNNIDFAQTTIDGVLNLNDGSELFNEAEMILRGEVRGATGTVELRHPLHADPGPANTAKIYALLEVRSFGFDTGVNVDSGTLSLLGGGTFGPGAATLVTTQPGTLLGFDFGTYQVLGSDIHVTAAPNSAARIRGAGTVVNIQAGGVLKLEGAGSIFLESSAQLGGPGDIINTGNFIWNSQLGVNGQATFINTFGSSSSGAVLIPVGGARLRGSFSNQSAGGGVLQHGTLDMATGTVTNEGNWVIQPASAGQIGITGVGGSFSNNFAAVISAEAPPTAGHSAQISTTLSNSGTVRAIGGITLTINGQLVQLQNGVLTGGTWETADGGRIILPGVPPITKLKNTNVVGSQQGMPWLAGVRNVEGAQLITIDDVTFTAPLRVDRDELEAPSVMRIGPGAAVTVPGSTTIGSPEQATMSFMEEEEVNSFLPDPPRLITPVLIVHGGIRPGGPDEAGPFNLTGQLSMQSTGMVEVELGGLDPESEHDCVTITGGAALTGMLNIKLLPGFMPQLGQTFTVLTTTGPITGTFVQVQQPGGSVQFEAAYSANAVTLTTVAGCYANCDGSTGSPTLTGNDFLCFINQFATSNPDANCDGSTGSPALTGNDFVCFITAYAGGCN